MDKKNNLLTLRDNWEGYWKSHKIKKVEKTIFKDYLPLLPKKGSLIEIGGFPGKIAAYFKSNFDYEVTILDYYIDDGIVKEVEKMYGLPPGSLNIIEADFLDFKTDRKYDIVLSVGFIEHFRDTKDILERHLNLLKDGGILIASIPNFRGLNGMIQRFFDKRNYLIHNINSMITSNLDKYLKELKVAEYEVKYIGKGTLWLEESAQVQALTRKFVKLLSKALALVPIKNNRILSPHIIIYANKRTC